MPLTTCPGCLALEAAVLAQARRLAVLERRLAAVERRLTGRRAIVEQRLDACPPAGPEWRSRRA